MQYFDLAQLSLAKGAGSSVTEMYIPLWVADGTTVNTTDTTGKYFLADGTSSTFNTGGNPNNFSQVKLHTLNSSWSASTKFAFETTLYASNSSYPAYAGLYDISAGSLVASSVVNTTATTATVLRSGQFTLTPGHIYGVSVYTQGGGTANYVDASLIVFP